MNSNPRPPLEVKEVLKGITYLINSEKMKIKVSSTLLLTIEGKGTNFFIPIFIESLIKNMKRIWTGVAKVPNYSHTSIERVSSVPETLRR